MFSVCFLVFTGRATRTRGPCAREPAPQVISGTGSPLSSSAGSGAPQHRRPAAANHRCAPRDWPWRHTSRWARLGALNLKARSGSTLAAGAGGTWGRKGAGGGQKRKRRPPSGATQALSRLTTQRGRGRAWARARGGSREKVCPTRRVYAPYDVRGSGSRSREYVPNTTRLPP